VLWQIVSSLQFSASRAKPKWGNYVYESVQHDCCHHHSLAIYSIDTIDADQSSDTFPTHRWAQPCTRDNYITPLRIEFAYCSWKNHAKIRVARARVYNKDWYRARRGLRNSARSDVMARMKSLSNHDFANRAKSWVTQGHRVMFWPAKCTRQM